MDDPARAGELVVVGTGIRLVIQTTPEALDCITRADKLLYPVTDPATETWLRRLNGAAETNARLLRARRAARAFVPQVWRTGCWRPCEAAHVCAAFYGHPGVFVNSGASGDTPRRAARAFAHGCCQASRPKIVSSPISASTPQTTDVRASRRPTSSRIAGASIRRAR